jgi:hypothetical protein
MCEYVGAYSNSNQSSLPAQQQALSKRGMSSKFNQLVNTPRCSSGGSKRKKDMKGTTGLFTGVDTSNIKQLGSSNMTASRAGRTERVIFDVKSVTMKEGMESISSQFRCHSSFRFHPSYSEVF